MSFSTKAFVELAEQGRALFGEVARQAEVLGQRPAVVREDPRGRVDLDGVDLLGRVVGHVLDVHAAFGGDDDGHPAGLAVDQQREVELAGDGGALFDIEAVHDTALGTGLVGDQGHAQHALGFLAHVVQALDHLDPAALAAAAGVDLGLDYPDRPAQLLGDADRVLH